MTLYAMIVPFTYIVWMEMVNKRPVKKSTLKICFYKHCYALAPSQILTVLFIALGFAFWPFWLLAVFAIPFYESFVFQAELDTTFKKAFLYAIVPQIVLTVILLIVILSTNLLG